MRAGGLKDQDGTTGLRIGLPSFPTVQQAELFGYRHRRPSLDTLPSTSTRETGTMNIWPRSTPPLSTAALLAALLAPGLAQAGLVNGDFEGSPDFTGWTTDTDGLGAPTPLAPDFSIVTSGPIGSGNRAMLMADLWSISGNTGSTALTQVQIANTLLQGLDLSVTPGHELVLSFDWAFGGLDGTPDENVQIGLNDGSNFYDANGNLGFLVTSTAYGQGHFSTTLAASYYNSPGFSLAFQLNSGFNGFNSFLMVDNVSLTQVPAPGTALLLVPALALMARSRRRAQAQSTQS